MPDVLMRSVLTSLKYGLGLEKLLQEGPVLDVGCNPGSIQEVKSQYPNTLCVGVNIKKGLMEHWSEIYSNQPARAEFVAATADHLSFADETFSLAYSILLFDYATMLSKPTFSLEKFVAEIYRVIKKGGVYVSIGDGLSHSDLFSNAGFTFIEKESKEYNMMILAKP